MVVDALVNAMVVEVKLEVMIVVVALVAAGEVVVVETEVCKVVWNIWLPGR